MPVLLTALWSGSAAAAPDINTSFTPAVIYPGQTSLVTVRLFNPALVPALDATVQATLPGGVEVVAPGLVTNSCGGAVMATTGTTQLGLSGGTIPAGTGIEPGICNVTVRVTGRSRGNYLHRIGIGALTTSNEGSNTQEGEATLGIVVQDFSIAKSNFAGEPLRGNSTGTLTLTLTNPNPVPLTQVAVTDTMSQPGGAGNLRVLAVPAPVSTCGGVLALTPAVAANGRMVRDIALTGGVIPASGSCSMSFTVEPSADPAVRTADFTNNIIPASSASSAEGATNGTDGVGFVMTATGGEMRKNFTPASIVRGTTSSLTIYLENRNATAITGVHFSDPYPAGLNPESVTSNSCGGTVSLAPTLTLTGGTIPGHSGPFPWGTCALVVQVRPDRSGSFVNTLPPQTLGGVAFSSSSATLTVNEPSHLSVGKQIAPVSVAAGETATVTIRLDNSHPTSSLVVDRVRDRLDTMSPFVVVSHAGGATTTCGGTLTATPGTQRFELVNATLAPASSCTITVPIYVSPMHPFAPGTSGLTLANVLARDQNDIVFNGGQSFAEDVSAVLTVWRPLDVQKFFTSGVTGPLGTVRMRWLITHSSRRYQNPLVNGSITDVLPAGHVVAPVPAASTTCAGATLSASPGGGTVTLTNLNIPHPGPPSDLTCEVFVDIRVPAVVGAEQTDTNQIPASQIEAFVPATLPHVGERYFTLPTAAAITRRVSSVAVNKEFLPNNINAGGKSRVRISFENLAASAMDLDGGRLTDTLPPQMLIHDDADPRLTGSAGCGASGFVATPGSQTATVTGLTLPRMGSCRFEFNVTSAVGGNHVNTLAPGDLVTRQGISNVDSASVTLTVNRMVNVSKGFIPSHIGPGGSATLRLTIFNASLGTTEQGPPGGLLVDTMPAGVQITGAGTTTCSGATVTHGVGGGGLHFLRLAGGSYPPQSTCTVTIPVTAAAAGSYVNTIAVGDLRTVSGTQNADPATATLEVLSPPLIHKSFLPAAIAPGAVSSLVLTLHTPQDATRLPIGFTDIRFSDVMTDLRIMMPPVVTSTCRDLVWNTPSDREFVVSAGRVPPGPDFCQITVAVTSDVLGLHPNQTSGVITAQTPVAGEPSNVAHLRVLAPPVVQKSFVPTVIAQGARTRLTFTLSHPDTGTLISNEFEALTDLFPGPAGAIRVADPPNLALTGCTANPTVYGYDGTATKSLAAGDPGIALFGGQFRAGTPCTVSLDVVGHVAGDYLNVSSPLATSNAGRSASGAQASLEVRSPAIDVIKSAAAPVQVAPLTWEVPYTVQVTSRATVALANVNVVDSLAATFAAGAPTFMIVPGSFAVTGTRGCAPPAAAYDGVTRIALLSGNAMLALNDACTIRFRVRVTYPNAGAVPTVAQNNQAYASSVSARSNTGGTLVWTGSGYAFQPPADTVAQDASTNGTTLPATANGDTPSPTPVLLAPQAVGVAKQVFVQTQLTPTRHEVVYRIALVNTGPSAATHVQVSDDAAAAFPAPASVVSVGGLTLAAPLGGASAGQCTLNPAFGMTNPRLLSGDQTLGPGEGCDLRITVTVDPNGATGPFLNQATATTHGSPPGSPGAANPSPVLATDLSDSGPSVTGTNPGAPGDTGGPDDPTPVTLSSVRIAAVKTASAARQIGLQRIEVDFTVGVANVGAAPATNLQLTDNLAATFSDPATLVSVGGLVNSATGGGASAADCAVNPAFATTNHRLMRGDRSLDPGQSCGFTFTVTVDLNGTTGPFVNQALAEAFATPPAAPGAPNPATPVAVDASDSGTDVNGTNPGQPGDSGGPNDPTPVPVALQSLGVAKAVTAQTQLSPARHTVTYRIAVQNTGTVAATFVQATDSLTTTFPAPAVVIAVTPPLQDGTLGGASAAQCAVNAGFSVTNPRLMSGQRTLAPGQGCVFALTVTVEPNGAPGPFLNTVTGNTHAAAPPADGAANPSTVLATDRSDSGTSPTGSNPGQPGDRGGPDDPTPVWLDEQRIGVAKAVSAIVSQGNGRYAIDFALVVGNPGAIAATHVQLVDDLVSTFPAPLAIESVGVPTVTAMAGGASAATCAVNPGFGPANPRLLSGLATFAPAAQCTIAFQVVVDASAGASGSLVNQAVATSHPTPPPTAGAGNPAAPLATDRSDSGTRITGTNPGAPGDTGGPDDPTPVRLPAVIEGAVWFDGADSSAGDGIRDPAEPGLPGWQVELVWPVGHPQANEVVTGLDGEPLVTLSGADGRYRFGDMVEGDYRIRFRAPASGGAIGAQYGTPVNGEQGSGSGSPRSRVNAAERVLEVKVRAGTVLAAQSLPVDPSGVVYDAVTRAPIARATVSLLSGSGQPLPPACLLNGQQHQVTPAGGLLAGAYRFDILVGADVACPPGASSYRIAVTAPGYSHPSALLPPAGTLVVPPGAGAFAIVPGGRAPVGDASTTYYLEFLLGSGARQVIHNHLPLDPATAGDLSIEKRVEKPEAELGDLVRYSIRVRNNSTAVIPAVVVRDRLPAGFRYIERTARLQEGSALAEPAGAPGPTLDFALGAIGPGQTVTFLYRVRLGVGSLQGDGINRARACQASGATVRTCSAEARARVRVTGGVFSPEACIAGKIFVDCNGNHVQDREEVGIPGVRLFLQSGLSIITDVEGKYSVCDLTPNTHTIKVDPITLPRGARLTTSSNRNAGDAGSLFVDLKNGLLQRADFIEGSCSNRVLEQVKARRAQGDVQGPETERQGGRGLSFETKAPGFAPQGTDSADQRVPLPRQGVRAGTPPAAAPADPVSRSFRHRPLVEIPVGSEGMPPGMAAGASGGRP